MLIRRAYAQSLRFVRKYAWFGERGALRRSVCISLRFIVPVSNCIYVVYTPALRCRCKHLHYVYAADEVAIEFSKESSSAAYVCTGDIELCACENVIDFLMSPRSLI